MTIVSPPFARKTAGTDLPIVVGHRGSRATHPENTLAGFEEAFRAGAEAVELDVIPTRDGVLVVTHDFRTADGQVIRQSLFSELSGIPRLEDIAQIPAGIFDIELKFHLSLRLQARAYAALLVDAVQRAGIGNRSIVRCFHPEVLQEVHRAAPKLPLAALTRNPLHNWVRLAARTRAAVVSPHYSLVTARRVREAERAGLFVIPWTANTPSVWQHLISAGVHGIITDAPRALLNYLRTVENFRQAPRTTRRPDPLRGEP